MGELIFNGIMLLFFLAMTIYSGSIEIWRGYVGARYWPMLILIFTDIIFLVKVIGIYKAMPAEERKFELKLDLLKNKGVQRLLAGFVITIAYVLLVEKLGFVISTILLGMAVSFLLGQRHFGKNLLINILLTMGVYAVFVWGLKIIVPRGAGIIYKFGYWLEYLL